MYVAELFFGWQGEGRFAGFPQLFVRFAGCPLRCAYCDTPDALVRTPNCAVRTGGEYADGGVERFPNPVTPEWAAAQLSRLAETSPSGRIHSVSLTGGEPLAQADGIVRLLPLLKARGLASYLETAGILPDRFAPLAPHLDHVAMDIKLPSATGQRERWDEHARFLAASDPAKTTVKLVVTDRTADADVHTAGALVAARSTAIPVFLQSATPVWRGIEPSSPLQLQRWSAALRSQGLRVFSGPQWHPAKHPLRSPAPAILAG